jgi:hypothetical protein
MNTFRTNYHLPDAMPEFFFAPLPFGVMIVHYLTCQVLLAFLSRKFSRHSCMRKSHQVFNSQWMQTHSPILAYCCQIGSIRRATSSSRCGRSRSSRNSCSRALTLASTSISTGAANSSGFFLAVSVFSGTRRSTSLSRLPESRRVCIGSPHGILFITEVISSGSRHFPPVCAGNQES